MSDDYESACKAFMQDLAAATPRIQRDFDAIAARIGKWAEDWRREIDEDLLQGRIDAALATSRHSALAEALVAFLVKSSTLLLAGSHGRILKGRFAVLGYGKLGSRELTAGSDLDMVFVYDLPEEVEETDGPAALAASAYYARLGQRLIRVLTQQVARGGLYEVDLRLRPHGEAGPVAARRESFQRYYRKDAWTWEHMALTRARTIAGDDDLQRRMQDEILAILAGERDQAKLLADVADMRKRIATQHADPKPWDVKHRQGGMIDIEFIAQYAQLLHARAHPEILSQSAGEALRRLGEYGCLEADAANGLADALAFWRKAQSAYRSLKAKHGGDLDNEDLFDRALEAASGLDASQARAARAAETAAFVQAQYARIVADPALALSAS